MATGTKKERTALNNPSPTESEQSIEQRSDAYPIIPEKGAGSQWGFSMDGGKDEQLHFL